MELKLFRDLIDALGKVAGGIKSIINLPKTAHETILRTLDETYYFWPNGALRGSWLNKSNDRHRQYMEQCVLPANRNRLLPLLSQSANALRIRPK